VNHVAEIDPDAEADALVLGHVRLTLGYALLDEYGAAHCVDHAHKFDQCPVAHELNDAPLVFFNKRLDELPAMCLEPSEGAVLVALHERRVANHVSGQDGG
jgi:hypothetical protein